MPSTRLGRFALYALWGYGFFAISGLPIVMYLFGLDNGGVPYR